MSYINRPLYKTTCYTKTKRKKFSNGFINKITSTIDYLQRQDDLRFQLGKTHSTDWQHKQVNKALEELEILYDEYLEERVSD